MRTIVETTSKKVDSLTVGELIQRFNRYNESIGKTVATQRWHKNSLRYFQQFIGSEVQLEGLSQENIDDYRASLVQKGLATESINTYLRSLRACLRWATRRRYITEPSVEVELLRRKVVATAKPVFDDSQGEIDKLIAATENEHTLLLQLRAKAIILTLHSTGLRASELCQAKYKNLTHLPIQDEVAHILDIESAKGGDPRRVVLSEAAWQAIKAYREELSRPHGQGYKRKGSDPSWLFVSHRNFDEPLTVSGLQRMMIRLEEHSGIKSNPHKWRHHAATVWINNGGGENTHALMKLMGWKSERMVHNYTRQAQVEPLVIAFRQYGNS